jgi:hypothetical protein
MIRRERRASGTGVSDDHGSGLRTAETGPSLPWWLLLIWATATAATLIKKSEWRESKMVRINSSMDDAKPGRQSK